MKYLAFVLAAGVAGVLSACSTVETALCTPDADWARTGQQDALAGETRDSLENRLALCPASVDMAAQKQTWEAGYRLGLMQYCKPAHVYAEGRSGRALAPVCPSGLTDSLAKHNQRGLAHFENNSILKRVALFSEPTTTPLLPRPRQTWSLANTQDEAQ